ncbi:hypothetical protein [Flavobacterium saccharophilum]|uniref:Uncharacterized protein n=1 Tax=Flavobacterium saccharophilum TaxID=29534 RepID=A0A1M7M0L8_9FLAO|nr:hypothetical protein [Flavobacterium saccharophilum]SHM84060.1 hypothetical protein SAMN05444366_4281 [Flavobacterium saccharophilum]
MSNENKLKHLEFLHNTINRMSANSFIIKGWVITLLSAIFVLADKQTNQNYIYLIFIVVPVFWYLNAYFLLQERKFRSLYNDVRIKKENEIDFSMNVSSYKNGKNKIKKCFWASSIWPLYIFLFIIALIVTLDFNSNKITILFSTIFK